jgi:N-acetylglutamate synthase
VRPCLCRMISPMNGVPEVVALERLAARSWRGLEEQWHGDWLLRAGGGFTGRANSVLVVGDPPEHLPAAVRTVTDWYARRGLRPRAQVPMPGAEEVDAAFDAAGWIRDDDNLVLTAPLDGWALPRHRVHLDPVPGPPGSAATATAALRCPPWPMTCWSTPRSRSSPRSAATRSRRRSPPSPAGCWSTAGSASPP